ncbi:MAG: hypothetical protein WDW38_004749 [Sanguina aurantia]
MPVRDLSSPTHILDERRPAMLRRRSSSVQSFDSVFVQRNTPEMQALYLSSCSRSPGLVQQQVPATPRQQRVAHAGAAPPCPSTRQEAPGKAHACIHP